jgi:hypothetical protein
VLTVHLFVAAAQHSVPFTFPLMETNRLHTL